MHQKPIEGQGHILIFDLFSGGQRSLINKVTTDEQRHVELYLKVKVVS